MNVNVKCEEEKRNEEKGVEWIEGEKDGTGAK